MTSKPIERPNPRAFLNVLTAILNPLLEGPFLRMTVFLTLEYCTFWGKKDDNVFCSVRQQQN